MKLSKFFITFTLAIAGVAANTSTTLATSNTNALTFIRFIAGATYSLTFQTLVRHPKSASPHAYRITFSGL